MIVRCKAAPFPSFRPFGHKMKVWRPFWSKAKRTRRRNRAKTEYTPRDRGVKCNNCTLASVFNEARCVFDRSPTHFKVKAQVRVCEMWTASCIEEVCEGSTNPARGFVMGWPTCNCAAIFRYTCSYRQHNAGQLFPCKRVSALYFSTPSVTSQKRTKK